MTTKRLTYRLDIATHPGITEEESTRMIRSFLKCAIRSYRIKCLSVERITHGSQAAVEDDTTATNGGERDE